MLGLLTEQPKKLFRPLLLHADTEWVWDDACQEVFTQAKKALTSSSVLAHYDPTQPLTLAVDVSAYGLGAVISHTYPDGTEHPVAFASHTLTSSEHNYAQIEKEALALVFGVKKFHQYLNGWKFTLVTDHKPLTTILGPKKGVPPLAAARLQHWTVLLSAYSYTIQYKDTTSHANADGLSRLPLTIIPQDSSASEARLLHLSQIDTLPVTFADIQDATKRMLFLVRYTPMSVEYGHQRSRKTSCHTIYVDST